MSTINKIPEIKGNKYFIRNGRGGRKDYGGYSPCIAGKIELFEGCTLNNCVGGAWGLFAMAHNDPNCKVGFISSSTYPQAAGSWYNNGKGSKWDTYERGKTPKLGSVICYTGYGDGHVAYVCNIEGDKLTLISSSYGSKDKSGFEYLTVYASNNYAIVGSPGLKFQGFIYPKYEDELQPQPKPSQDITSDEALTVIAKDVIAGKYGNGFLRKDRIYQAVQNKVNKLLRG